jgi:hypothetical protein
VQCISKLTVSFATKRFWTAAGSGSATPFWGHAGTGKSGVAAALFHRSPNVCPARLPCAHPWPHRQPRDAPLTVCPYDLSSFGLKVSLGLPMRWASMPATNNNWPGFWRFLQLSATTSGFHSPWRQPQPRFCRVAVGGQNFADPGQRELAAVNALGALLPHSEAPPPAAADLSNRFIIRRQIFAPRPPAASRRTGSTWRLSQHLRGADVRGAWSSQVRCRCTRVPVRRQTFWPD